MALEVRCDCGNVYSINASMAGRKVRCGNCGQVVRVPETSAPAPAPAPSNDLELELAPPHEVAAPPPVDDLMLPPDDDMMAAPAPMELPDSMLSMEEDAGASMPPPPVPEMDDEEEEEEEEVPQTPRCPVCGTDCSPEDTVCLACGADIGNSGGAGGAINKLLDKVPPKARIGIGVGVAVLLVFWAGFAIWKSRQDSSYVSAAQTKLDLEDYKGALQDYKTALTWNKNNVDAIEGVIKCSLKIDPNANIAGFTRNLGSAARDEDADKEKIGKIYFILAEYYTRQIKGTDQKSQSARGNAQKYLDTSKRISGAALEGDTELRGHINFRARDWIQAKTYYTEAASNNTEDSLVYLNLARIFLKDGDADKAKEYISKAQSTNPAEANVELAKIKEKEKKYEVALGHWKAAVDAKSDLHPARIGYGRALMRASKYPDALKQVDVAMELLSDVSEDGKKATYALRANALFRLNKFVDALKQAEELLALDPENKKGQFVKGAILIKQGLKNKDLSTQKQGKSLLDKAVRALNSPKDYVIAAEILGQIKAMQLDALRYTEAALTIESKYAEAHLLRVRLLEEKQNVVLIEKALVEALEALPKNIELSLKLANLYWGKNTDKKQIEALDLLRKLRARNPKSKEVLSTLADKLYDRGREDREPPLEDQERAPLLKEALKHYTNLRDTLKSNDSSLRTKIRAVKTQLAFFE